MIYGYINAPKRKDAVASYITQKDSLNRAAKLYDINELQLFVDKTKAPLANRVELQKLVRSCKEYDKILCYSPEVLTSDYLKLQLFEYLLQRLKLQLLYVTPPQIPLVSLYRDKHKLMAAVYEYEKMKYHYCLKSKRVELQPYIRGAAPYGYRKVKDGEEVQLEPHPIEQANLLLIHDLRAKGYQLQQICKELNERNIKPRRAREWEVPALCRLLKKMPVSVEDKPEPPQESLAASVIQSLSEGKKKNT